MPGWQFWRRRSSAVKAVPQAHSEKAAHHVQLAGPFSDPSNPPSTPQRQGAAQQQTVAGQRPSVNSKRQESAGRESIVPRKSSVENITALPISRKLQSSPHLRPVDSEQRAQIPYTFRQHATSQTSIQRSETRSPRPHSKRSTYSSGQPDRQRSHRSPVDSSLREEEIRQMHTPMSTPKRPGDGPLRKDSKKIRRAGAKGSTLSLPPEESIHSTMSGSMEQRGWEIGNLDIFNPRPAVRLSGAPQYVPPSSAGALSPLSKTVSSREDETEKAKDKRPVTSDSARKRRTIGNQADGFDASDLRMLMERDAKRREKRKIEQQEKLDRKLRSRNGRNRGDSDRRQREADELRREEEAKLHADAVQRARDSTSTPTDVHPALRGASLELEAEAEADNVGLGIGATEAATVSAAVPVDELEQRRLPIMPTTEELGTVNTGTYLNYPQGADIPENPFEDPVPSPAPTETDLERLPTLPGAFTPLETPMEDPIVHTAKAVRLSQALTPPLSPARIGPSGLSQSITHDVLSGSFTSDLPSPPPIGTAERRTSEPEPKERRAGAWASFFRRGGTTLKRPGEDGRSSPSDFSFSNTSRESMRNQPLPAHLVGLDATLPSQRSKSIGAPVRAKSKFREDLPEMPISPPDSRMPSPDITIAAAAAAAARRGRRRSKPIDAPIAVDKDQEHDSAAAGRNDIAPSPSMQRRGLVSASMASVDSEGSWLASSGQRQSMQSVLSRSIGSLSKRKAEFNASYEELGGDKDAEYVQRGTSGTAYHSQRAGSPAMAGASPDEESEYDLHVPETIVPSEPSTVVRRKPTLVVRDLRVKSREGLLAEYASGPQILEEQEHNSPDSPTSVYEDQFDLESPVETQLQSARSVHYGSNHARHVSAGSAKLLDIKRSMDAGSRDSSAEPPLPVRNSQLQ